MNILQAFKLELEQLEQIFNILQVMGLAMDPTIPSVQILSQLIGKDPIQDLDSQTQLHIKLLVFVEMVK